MNDLFPADSSVEKPAAPDSQENARFDWINLFVKERRTVPDGWEWYKVSREAMDTPQEFLLLEGAVCTALIERGKRKGAKNWKLRDKSTETKLAIPFSELDAFKLDWQSKNNKCFRCYGTGDVWTGWSAAEGNRYAACRHCDGTGVPKAKAA